MTREEAVRSFTTWNAHAAFQERRARVARAGQARRPRRAVRGRVHLPRGAHRADPPRADDGRRRRRVSAPRPADVRAGLPARVCVYVCSLARSAPPPRPSSRRLHRPRFLARARRAVLHAAPRRPRGARSSRSSARAIGDDTRRGFAPARARARGPEHVLRPDQRGQALGGHRPRAARRPRGGARPRARRRRGRRELRARGHGAPRPATTQALRRREARASSTARSRASARPAAARAAGLRAHHPVGLRPHAPRAGREPRRACSTCRRPTSSPARTPSAPSWPRCCAAGAPARARTSTCRCSRRWWRPRTSRSGACSTGATERARAAHGDGRPRDRRPLRRDADGGCARPLGAAPRGDGPARAGRGSALQDPGGPARQLAGAPRPHRGVARRVRDASRRRWPR